MHTLGVFQNTTETPDSKHKAFEFISCCVFWKYELRVLACVLTLKKTDGNPIPDMEIISFDAGVCVNICVSDHIIRW